ncbi:phage tail sheath C-terminal domain-containing protein [Mycobacterium sp. PDNC021]|uniref:phage tail sheath C-terminal domain-containing protein n=1 Tax=Mycobacterium sp. PDNC021 TaxID=3391399 RepID=UPI003AAF8AEE
MPEYLSPGVYVEEVELGPRPIEGVSTSTAGVVGVAERGPVNVPVLITSDGDYRRVYGGPLRPDDFPDSWYLPLSIRGFFQNQGQRAYVVRVVPDGATKAAVDLMGQGSPTGFSATVLAQIQTGDTQLVVTDDAGLVAGQTLRIDDGAVTEYIQFGSALGALDTLAQALMSPAYATDDFAAPPAVPVNAELRAIAAAVAPDDYAGALAVTASAGSDLINVNAPPAKAFAPGDLLQIGVDAYREIVTVGEVPADPADLSLRLATRLARTHAAGVAVERVTAGAPTNQPINRRVNQGDGMAFLGGPPIPPDSVVAFLGNGAHTYQVVGTPAAVGLRQPVTIEHPTGGVVSVLTMAAGAVVNFAAAAPAGATVIRLTAVAATPAGTWLALSNSGPGSGPEFALVHSADATTNTVTLAQPTRFAHDGAATATVQAPATQATTLIEVLRPGNTTALLGFTVAVPALTGDVLQIGTPGTAGFEYLELGAVLTPQVIALPAGPPVTTVANGHRPGVGLLARSTLFTVEALDVGGYGNELRVKVEEEAAGTVQTTVAVTTPPGADVPVTSITGVEPGSLLEILEVSTTIDSYVLAGSTRIRVDNRAGLLVGDWVRVGRTDAEYVRIAALPAAPTDAVDVNRPLTRDHSTGEWVDRMGAGGLPRLAAVADRVGTNSVRFDGGGLPVPVTAGWTIRSRDFKLTVEWVKRGPANPRNPGLDLIVETETYRHLTLDSRHSQYVGTVIGLTTGPVRLWDRRTHGQSNLIRVTTPLDPMQPGPDIIEEVVAGGRRRPVGRYLSGGDDDIAALADATYKGNDNVDPLARTGLQSLRSVEDVALVAIPGRVSTDLQQEVITHCESMHYRFAVLDALPGTESTGAGLADVQDQRQQFDTKYAALYYPWLRLPDPFSAVISMPPDISVPPSGHLLGVYARTDVTRGVHKAPANEVITGITGFQRSITKGEQDILNPYPSNINVLRDFRENFRGLRSWGGRVITSDPEWKYVNVRRLFIFVERSLELGLQWVVFEPNDENLWARVTRTVSNFLTTVWRSGALMGLTAEQAFFVRCDRTTMTQDDIDNGRLILVIGIAPTMPAEFVVIRIGQWQGGSAVEEA